MPHDAGVKALGELTQRGVRVAVLTNSLAATDAVAVQAGYSPYRVPLLQARRRAVRIQADQPKANAPRAGLFGSQSRASLHAKTYVIDRSILVIGSMNLDPRSAHLNTELALVIHSQPIADEVAQTLRARHGARGELSRRRSPTPAQLADLRSIGAPLSPLVWTDVEERRRAAPTTSIRKRACTGTR